MKMEPTLPEFPNPERDYEFVLQCKREAEQQAGLARTCEWRIDAATGEDADAIADAADKAANITKERATAALNRAFEAARVGSSDAAERQSGELALQAAAQTVHAAAEAQRSARIVSEFWMANALATGRDAF